MADTPNWKFGSLPLTEGEDRDTRLLIGASSYWRELPVMALADYSELFETIFITDLSPLEKEQLILLSRSFRQYLRFAEAVRRADELQVRMLID